MNQVNVILALLACNPNLLRSQILVTFIKDFVGILFSYHLLLLLVFWASKTIYV